MWALVQYKDMCDCWPNCIEPRPAVLRDRDSMPHIGQVVQILTPMLRRGVLSVPPSVRLLHYALRALSRPILELVQRAVDGDGCPNLPYLLACYRQ